MSRLYEKAKSKHEAHTSLMKPVAVNIIKKSTTIGNRLKGANASQEDKKIPCFSKSRVPQVSKKPLLPLKTKRLNYLDKYLKVDYLKEILCYIPSKYTRNLMLVCRKFYSAVTQNDEFWYLVYRQVFKTYEIDYSSCKSAWRENFLNQIRKKYLMNRNSIINSFSKKLQQKSYQYNKDPTFYTSNLYSLLAKSVRYRIKVNEAHNGQIGYNIKASSTHINFLCSLDNTAVKLNELHTVRLVLSESNIGLNEVDLASFVLRKLKMSEIPVESKISRVFFFQDCEMFVSTFKDYTVFFINISIPICRICEVVNQAVFINERMVNLHSNHLYFDDCERDFGLIDYSLLVNVKSWKESFFSLLFNTVDFKQDQTDSRSIVFRDSSTHVCSSMPCFPIRSIAFSEDIKDLLILDLILLSYKGDHVVCESHPIKLVIDSDRVITYEQEVFEYFTASFTSEKISGVIDFKYSKAHSDRIFCVDRLELRLNTVYLAKVFKRC